MQKQRVLVSTKLNEVFWNSNYEIMVLDDTVSGYL